jgi:hypothetical protein
MSVSGISSSNFFNQSVQAAQSPFQQFQQDFQQLGQALQSGNLSAAQSDFVTLQQLVPQPAATSTSNSASTAQNTNPLSQTFSQLSQALQNGNLSAAQQDFTAIQQDFQNQAAQGTQHAEGHHHHHHGGGGGDEANTIMTDFDQLGEELQSGNLSSAQQTYSALQQQFQMFGQGETVQPQSTALAGSSMISVSA